MKDSSRLDVEQMRQLALEMICDVWLELENISDYTDNRSTVKLRELKHEAVSSRENWGAQQYMDQIIF